MEAIQGLAMWDFTLVKEMYPLLAAADQAARDAVLDKDLASTSRFPMALRLEAILRGFGPKATLRLVRPT